MMQRTNFIFCLLLKFGLNQAIEGSSFLNFKNITANPLVSKPFGMNGFPRLKYKIRVETKGREAIKYIYQKVDHFNDSDTRDWKMRYFVNSFLPTFGSGPLFIRIEGESEASVHYALFGHFRDIAKKNKAYYVVAEHRFYGDSRPFSNITTANLQYLNSQQAIGDLAHLIRVLRSNVAGLANSKVIVCGGSYAGRLAILLKNMYPGYVDGVWASSPPLIAKTEFPEQRIGLGNAIRKFSGNLCYQRIKDGIFEIQRMGLSTSNFVEIKRLFEICDGFSEKNGLNTWTWYLAIANSFDFLKNEYDVKQACESILTEKDDIIAIAHFVVKKLIVESCLNLAYPDTIAFLSNITDFYSYRQWYFQSCNEFGWFPTSRNNSEPFGKNFPLTYFTIMCHDVFGAKYTEEFINDQVKKTNEHFSKYNNMSNVYITVGEFDPWRPTIELPNYNVTVLPGEFHCSDFDSQSPLDSPEMRASKDKIEQLISQWIN